MSSTHPDDKPEDQREWQSAAISLGEQSSAVSPLLDNIIGGVARFGAVSHEALLAAENVTVISDLPESSLDAATEQPSRSESQLDPVDSLNSSNPSATASPSNPEMDLSAESSQGDSSSSPLHQLRPSLSDQYGDVGLLAELHSLAKTQQFQLKQHRESVQRSRAAQGQQLENWAMRCAALEQQLQDARDRATLLEQRHLASQSQVFPLEAQRDAAQQLTERLQTEILDRRQQQAILEEQLNLAEATLRDQHEITAAQSRGIVAMQAELSQAQAQVAALETRLSHQDHLRQQLKTDGNRDRQDRSQARDRQLQLEQETTQMTGQLLRLSEELRQAQRQSNQWRRQAQTQAEQLREITQWAAQAESVSPELMALLEPLFQQGDDEAVVAQYPSSPTELHGILSIMENSGEMASEITKEQAGEVAGETPGESVTSSSSSLNLPNFPHGSVSSSKLGT